MMHEQIKSDDGKMMFKITDTITQKGINMYDVGMCKYIICSI